MKLLFERFICGLIGALDGFVAGYETNGQIVIIEDVALLRSQTEETPTIIEDSVSSPALPGEDLNAAFADFLAKEKGKQNEKLEN